jgi:hypothetical protein
LNGFIGVIAIDLRYQPRRTEFAMEPFVRLHLHAWEQP